MQLPDPDAFLIDKTDAFMGYAETKGHTIPSVQKEVILVELAAVAVMPAAAFLANGPWSGGIFMVLSTFNGLNLYRLWKLVKADAQREWDEAMVRKYLKSAGIARHRMRWHRVYHVGLMTAAIVLAAVMLYNGMGRALDAIMVLWFVSTGMRIYLDCAVPRPPKRRTEFKPAFGLG